MSRELTDCEKYELAIHMARELYPMDPEKAEEYIKHELGEDINEKTIYSAE